MDRMDGVALVGPSSSEGAAKSISLDGAKRMAMKHIEAFVLSFSDPQMLSMAALSSAPASVVQIAESARIQEAGNLRCRFLIYFLKWSEPLRQALFSDPVIMLLVA